MSFGDDLTGAFLNRGRQSVGLVVFAIRRNLCGVFLQAIVVQDVYRYRPRCNSRSSKSGQSPDYANSGPPLNQVSAPSREPRFGRRLGAAP